MDALHQAESRGTATADPVTPDAAPVWYALGDGRKVNLRDWKVVLFMQSTCQYCRQFAPVLKTLSQQIGLDVFPVSLDGKGDTEFPDVLPATPDVMVEYFQSGLPVATPTTFLTNVNTMETWPLLQGAAEAGEFRSRLDAVLRMALIGETRRLKFSEQTSFGHEQVRDGISFGKEEERVSIVSYSDVQSLNDLQCFVTLPGSYPVVKLTMKYEAMPKVADSLLLRDVQISLDQTIEDELVRRTEEERSNLDGLFNPVKPVAESSLPEVAPAALPQPVTSPSTDSPATAPVNTTSSAGTVTDSSVATGGTERDIEQDLPRDIPPGVNSDGEVVDFHAYEAWAQTSHQTRDMTRREETNINLAAEQTHDFDDEREVL